METKRIIVAFKIGRGGRFNNGGHKSYKGQYDISHFCDKLFWTEEEEFQNEGEYLNQEIKDECGNGVGLTVREMNFGIGRIDFDGEYDTIYTEYLDNLSEEEKRIILDYKRYKGYEVEEAFKNADKFIIVTETSEGTKYVGDDNSDRLNYQDARLFDSYEDAENCIEENEWIGCHVETILDLI